MPLKLIVCIVAAIPQYAIGDESVVRRRASHESIHKFKAVVRRAAGAASVKALSVEVLGDGEVKETPGSPLVRINKLSMLWLPTHPASSQRIQSYICSRWPEHLKRKLVLVDGISAQDDNWNVSRVMERRLAREIFGPAAGSRLAEATHMPDAKNRAGSVALVVGHMAIWREVAEGPEEGWTIVLEDDAILKPEHQHLAALEGLRAPLDPTLPTLVMLDPRHYSASPGKCAPCPVGCGTVAYAIDRKAARYLLEHATLSLALDVFFEQIQGDGLKMVCPIKESPFEHGPCWGKHGPCPHGKSIRVKDSLIQTSVEGVDSDVDLRVCKHAGAIQASRIDSDS